jgi:hypothetical protein
MEEKSAGVDASSRLRDRQPLLAKVVPLESTIEFADWA